MKKLKVSEKLISYHPNFPYSIFRSDKNSCFREIKQTFYFLRPFNKAIIAAEEKMLIP